MPTEVFRLPNFRALLPRKKPGGEISPHLKEADIAFNAWVKGAFDTRLVTEVLHFELPLLMALGWPLASSQQLGGILDCMIATMILEHWTDSCSSVEALAWSELWVKILRGGTSLEGEKSRHPWIKIIHSELVPKSRTAVEPFHWPQFVADCEKFAMSIVQEALDREAHMNSNSTRDIQSYTILRRETVGARPCFVLIRSTRYLYIPDDVLAHPAIQEMENAAVDLLWIANDVFSYKKEYAADGALNNLLTAMQEDPDTYHLDLQGRLDYTEMLFRAALDRFTISRRRLPSFDPEMDEYLTLYTDGLIDLIIGNLEWSPVTRRYSTFVDDEDRKNNIMRLTLESSLVPDGNIPLS